MAKQRASKALTRVVGDLAGQIADGVRPALADEPDAVHQLRTAVRRMRGVVAAFDPYLDDTGWLRAGLADCGERLGLRRDAEVRAADAHRAAVALDLSPADTEALAGGPDLISRDAQTALVAWAHGAAARQFLDDLTAWGRDPRFTDRAHRRTRHVMREAVRRERRRVLARAAVMARGDEEQAHEIRKAARRLRHVADAAAPYLDGKVRERTIAAGSLGRDIQGHLGDHRDAVLLAGHAREVGLPRVEAWAREQSATALTGLPAALLALAGDDRI